MVVTSELVSVPNSLLAGKIQGILPISRVGSSQRVQNIGSITMCCERIPGAVEQGNFRSHQGTELGNQLLSGNELSLALFGICAKRKYSVVRDESTW